MTSQGELDVGDRSGEAVSDSKPDVTTVIATRDRPELVRRALASVAAQDYEGVVGVVLVFDQSEPDPSLVVDDPKRPVQVTTNDRSPGLAGSRNTGIGRSTGPYVALLDDDDEWHPEKIRRQVDVVTRSGDAVATTGIEIAYNGQRTPRLPDPARLNRAGFLRDRMTEVHPSSLLIARSAFDRIGLVDEDIPNGYGEDYDLLLRLAEVSGFSVVDSVQTTVWWHGASYFFERWKTIDEALDYLVDKHPDFQSCPEGLARIRGQQAFARAAMGHRREAIRLCRTTFGLNRRELRAYVAPLVAAGVPAGAALRLAHRFGKGI